MLGLHSPDNAQDGLASFASTGSSGLTTTGYTSSQLSRMVNNGIHHSTLYVGYQLVSGLHSAKRLPAMQLHIKPSKLNYV